MKRILKISLFALLGIAVLWTFWFLWKKSRPEEVIYNVVSPQTLTITRKTVATGKVNPRDEVNIVPQISGIVSKLLKEPGDKVTKDEIIATIKVIPDVGTLNNAETQLDNAELNFQLAQTEFGRVRTLFEGGVATDEEYQKSRNALKTAEGSLEGARNNLEIIKNGVASKYASYSNTNIKSTVSGMILSIPVKVGNSVIQANTMNAGTTIATVADMSDMQFVGNIDETEVGNLRDGMALRVTVGALKDIVFPARLEYISPKSTEDNGAILFEIKAAVSIPDSVFVRAGYSANAEIILEEARDVLTVPESTVFFEEGESYVYLSCGDDRQQKFEKRKVALGLSDGINVEVKSGLAAGERIRGDKQENTGLKQ